MLGFPWNKFLTLDGSLLNPKVYENNFDSLDGLSLVQTAGTVTIAPAEGTDPYPGNALTITNISAGNAYASYDLGETYDELYIQFFVNVVKSSTASSYKDCFQIGASVAANECCEIKMNHSAGYYQPYGVPNYLYIGRYVKDGVWMRYGIKVDRVAKIAYYYINGRYINSRATNDKDLRYITFGGSNVSGYKLQFANLTIRKDRFETVSTDVGTVINFYVSELGDTTWSGMHKVPYDPNGGTNYVDGPVKYMNALNTSSYYLVRDNIKFNKGAAYKMETLAAAHKIARTGSSVSNFGIISSYGTGDIPVIDMSVLANSANWVEYDAINHIYSYDIANASLYVTAVWVDELKGLLLSPDLTTMETNPGTWLQTTTKIYVRLYDDGNPSSHTIDIASNQPFSLPNYFNVNDLKFRFSEIISPAFGILENCECEYGAGINVSESSIVRDNTMSKLWGGLSYGGILQGIGPNGLRLQSINAKVYRNKIDSAYIGIQISPNAHGSFIAFNEVKNTIVNSIQISGSANPGIDANPIWFINNTVFHSPRHKQNDPYYLQRDQPGHGFVHQLGGGAVFRFINNMILTHYAELIGGQSVMNCISLINPAAKAIIDYNMYHLTEISTDPAEIFNMGDGFSVSAWTTALGAYMDCTGIDGLADSHSVVSETTPVVEANALVTSGKFDETDGTPVITGNGYAFDFSAYGITTDLSGNAIGNTRNIGAY